MADTPPMTWRTDVKVAWEMKARGHAQLGAREGAMLYYLARDWFSGEGVITELGSFLGASASLLGKGIKDNPNYKGGKVLHCFDLWEAKFGNMAEFIRDKIDPNFQDGGDFLPFFWDQVGDASDVVEIHKGDFAKATWDGTPIDLVFIDISKSSELNTVVLKQFVSALKVGGLMVNQDFHNPANIWVQVTMGPLLDYFSVYEGRADDTAAFVLDREIPADALEDAARYDDLSVDEKVARIDRTMDAYRDDDYSERYVDICRARVLAEGGRFDEADAALEAADARMGKDYDKKADWFWEYRLSTIQRIAGNLRAKAQAAT